MSKVYSFEDCQPVIKEAFKKALDHLKETLGDQYKCRNTDDARCLFYDKVEQDIEFKMTCDRCGKVDGECDFQEHQDYGNLCYDCYEEKGGLA